jgi:hypothetical protein
MTAPADFATGGLVPIIVSESFPRSFPWRLQMADVED